MKNFRISVRLYGLVALTLCIMAAAMALQLKQSYTALIGERTAMLRQMDQNVVTIFKHYHDAEVAGDLTHEEAQKRALEATMAMRYGKDGYFAVISMDGKFVAHPIKPQLKGKDAAGLTDPDGRVFGKEIIKVGSEQGGGLVTYMWPKPGSETAIEKYSYVEGFKPWRWIVLTGSYADDIDALFWTAVTQAAAICLGAFLIALAAAFLIVRSVVGPVSRIKAAMGLIAEQDVSSEIPETDRGDEIGDMAQALVVLRDSVRERQELQARDAEQQQQIADERQANSELQLSSSRAQARVVETLGEALEKLASGDLTVEIPELTPEYEKLRSDFNAAAGSLRSAIEAITHSTDTVNGTAEEISQATDNLSRRTEQQAASLEETAAALDEITSTVKSASGRADEAHGLMNAAKTSAEQSGTVVRSAIDAMGRIEQSSTQINQIIGVIDEIAFQTNLLALNAGVEAARAGDAGRGFAVVAQEVRELAQRSANAAKEIKDLIRNSTSEVGSGVELVQATGDALAEIERQVITVSEHVAAIATSAREQSAGLQEINVAVNQMDQVTQQNAAMVEETTAASATLASESEQLRKLVSRFRLSAAGSARKTAPVSARAA